MSPIMHNSKNQFYVYKICEAQNDTSSFLLWKLLTTISIIQYQKRTKYNHICPQITSYLLLNTIVNVYEKQKDEICV
jgi:hypothetical protein